MMKIGLLHPGAMGAAVGAAAAAGGHRVRWASVGRATATLERAQRAPLEDVGDLTELAADCELVLSICPPSAAAELASQAVAAGFAGVYVECNAVSPARTLAIRDITDKAGLAFVDGGIVGGPPWVHPNGARPATCLYLSGPRPAEVAGCFTGSPLAAIVVDEQVGSASALKMAYAARTKGVVALWRRCWGWRNGTAFVSCSNSAGEKN